MNDLKQKIIELDLRGQVCPSTLLVAMDRLNSFGEDLRQGNSLLHIITDNRDAIHTIPETATNMGYQVEVKKTATYYEIMISCLLSE